MMQAMKPERAASQSRHPPSPSNGANPSTPSRVRTRHGSQRIDRDLIPGKIAVAKISPAQRHIPGLDGAAETME